MDRLSYKPASGLGHQASVAVLTKMDRLSYAGRGCLFLSQFMVAVLTKMDRLSYYE